VTTKEVAIRGSTALAEHDEKQFSSALAVTPEYINQTKQSLALLREMIKDVMVEGRDYGSVPGVPEEFLWDPGASQIVAAFNCRIGSPTVLNQVMTDTLIAVVLEVPIISFQTKEVVAVCVGAASTSEVKHKYRNVRKDELADWGYVTDEQVKTLKSKRDKWNNVKYRIPNPEPGELLNTIWKIAFKRGRVGAAQLLPGVSAALREKFAKPAAGSRRQEQKGTSDWDVFWAKTKQMGLESDQVHGYLKVKSMKEWVATGQDLDQALAVLAHQMGKVQTQEAEAESPFDDEPVEDTGPFEPPPMPPPAPAVKNESPVTKELTNQIYALLKNANISLPEMGERIRKELKFDGITALKDLKMWQADEVKSYLKKATGG
jgi:hypothetical protein